MVTSKLVVLFLFGFCLVFVWFVCQNNKTPKNTFLFFVFLFFVIPAKLNNTKKTNQFSQTFPCIPFLSFVFFHSHKTKLNKTKQNTRKNKTKHKTRHKKTRKNPKKEKTGGKVKQTNKQKQQKREEIKDFQSRI